MREEGGKGGAADAEGDAVRQLCRDLLAWKLPNKFLLAGHKQRRREKEGEMGAKEPYEHVSMHISRATTCVCVCVCVDYLLFQR